MAATLGVCKTCRKIAKQCPSRETGTLNMFGKSSARVRTPKRTAVHWLTLCATCAVLTSSLPVLAASEIPLPQPHPKRSAAAKIANPAPDSRAQTKLAQAAIPPVPTRRPKTLSRPDPGLLEVKTTLAAEKAHNQKFDALIKPLLDFKISQSDKDNLLAAIRALKKSKLETAASLQNRISDPAARKLVTWFRLRGGFGAAAEHAEFLDNNPAWPNRWLIAQRLEEALFVKGGTVGEIKAYFKKRKPETGVGYAALASAYQYAGNKDKAREIAAKAWREEKFPIALEAAFLKRFEPLLTTADHKYRIDRLMLNAPRWRSQKKAKAKEIRRLIPLLPKAEQKKAYARLNVFLGRKNASGAAVKVSDKDNTDWGSVFHKVQVLRRKKKLDAAAKLIIKAPLDDKSKIVNPDAWWKERRYHAYLALDAGNARRAYDLVKVAGNLSDNPKKQQAFTAGWIALRYLKDSEAGIRHMKIMKAAADGPLSRAKSAYWLGRAYEQAGQKAAAIAEYRAASAGVDTFHGQLALLELNAGQRGIELKEPATPTKQQLERFYKNDAVRAAIIAHDIGLGRVFTRPFFAHLRSVMPSEAEVALMLHLTRALGDTQMSIRMAKKAIGDGHNVLYYSYPVHAFPTYKPLRKPPEPAFLLSIARQESEFEPKTKSGAGARGILQVMPITARHVCRDYKIKCNIPRLMTDVSYNTRIASAYIADRMGEFKNSYILGLAGYNAGPGRARQWIRKFGDPRDPKIDPIDWIERIPFQETRRYVTKVLSSIQIYRARLGETDPRRLDLDLFRARPDQRKASVETISPTR